MRVSELVEAVHTALTAIHADTTSEAEHNLRVGKAHAMRIEEENAADSPDYQLHKSVSESHFTRAEECVKAAAGVLPALQACEKAMETGELEKAFRMDGDELLPIRVSGIAPEPNETELRMIPRAGSPPLAQKAELPEIFKTLVAVDED